MFKYVCCFVLLSEKVHRLDWVLEISLIHTLEHFVSTLIILQRLRSTDINHLTLLNFTFTAVGNHFNAWFFWCCPVVFPYCSLVSPLWHLSKTWCHEKLKITS